MPYEHVAQPVSYLPTWKARGKYVQDDLETL